MSIKAKILRIAAVFATVTALLTPLALASTQNISIPIDTVVWGDAYTTHTLKNVPVDNGDYQITATSRNQDSIHPNTNLTIRSGNSALVIYDVENEKFTTATAEGTLQVTNGQVEVLVTLGKDRVFSGGLDVVLNRVIKDIEVCRPGTGVITIKETDKKSTDLDKNDPACKDTQVCRPGVGVITIKNYEKKGGDLAKDDAKCKDVTVCRPGTGVITIKGWDKKSTDLDKDADACKPNVKVCDTKDGKIKEVKKGQETNKQYTTDLTQCEDIKVCDPKTGKVVTIKKYDSGKYENVDSGKCKDVTVCRPNKGVITIKESDKKSTDLDKNSDQCKDTTVCRPGKGIVTIKGWDRKTTDLDKDAKECQPKPEYVNVCDTKDGKVKQIKKGKESDKRYTTDLAQCDTTNVCNPQTGQITSVKNYNASNFEPADSDSCKEKPAPSPAPEPTPVVPTELPQTGLTDTLIRFIGVTTTTAAAVAFYRSRQ